MIRDIIKNYKKEIETPEEMVSVLTAYRNDLMEEYSTYGWEHEMAFTGIDLILRLDEVIRKYKWDIKMENEKKVKYEKNNTISE
jgi:hypothetical protein